MTGHLHLETLADASGRTSIGHQSFHAPMHISKPYWDGGYLIINAINATAGIFAGDEIDIRIRAASGSSTVFTSPSASRVHRSPDSDGIASVRNSFEVEAGAWLDVYPEIFIPQGGARYEQTTRLDVHKDGQLFFMESLAPGRTASGETFAFSSLDWTTDLFVDGVLLFRERYNLSPESLSTHALRVHHPNSYYASCVLFSKGLGPESGIRQTLSAHSTGDTLVAACFPAENLLVIKILAEGSLCLKKAIDAVRASCYSALGKAPPELRKL